jgi:hypothetical protein
VVYRRRRRLFCRQGQQRPAADIHLLQGRYRPPIPHEAIDPQCRATDRSGHCQAARAIAAEFERELIRERTGEGRKRAMAAGVKFGRKRKLSDYQRAEAIKRRAAGETLASIAKSYGVHLAMISRL